MPGGIAEQEGEIAGISYRVRGAGAPLVLLPLDLSPGQWEPLIPALSAEYCTVTLGGALLGSVASLEERGRSGYIGVVRALIDGELRGRGTLGERAGKYLGRLDFAPDSVDRDPWRAHFRRMNTRP